MNYELLYKEAKDDLKEFLIDEAPEFEEEADSLDLMGLVDELINRYNSVMLMYHVSTIGYEVGVTVEKMDDYLEAAEEVIKDIEELDDIDDEKLIEIAKKYCNNS